MTPWATPSTLTSTIQRQSAAVVLSIGPAGASYDGAEIRLQRPRAFLEPGQGHRAALRVAGVAGDMGADEVEAMAVLGQPGQELGEVDARGPRGNDGVGPAIVGRRVRFRVAGIEVARSPPEKNKDHRPRPPRRRIR